jgi:hypothetical protein
LELNGQIGKNKWLMIKHVLPHEIKRVYLDWYSIMGWSGVEWNEIGWNKINFLFYNLDILKGRDTNFAFHHLSLKLEWNKIESKWWYEMKSISSYSIPLLFFKFKQQNIIQFYPFSFHSIYPNKHI